MSSANGSATANASDSTTANVDEKSGGKAKLSPEEAIEHAKRAFALKKYEQAVEHYATALEQITERDGENAPGLADLYFAYGKALLENAIAHNSVLGKEQTDDALGAEDEDAKKSGAFLSFSGDGEEEDQAVDLFAEAQAAGDHDGDGGGDDEGDDDEGDDDDEPEDDFNAAWEVLEAARAKYEKEQEDNDEVKLKLAETFITLGDVSLETEKFDQAITDYSAGLELKVDLLPVSSRQIAEAHYKLSMVLDLSAGRLSDAIMHAERALESVAARMEELRAALGGQKAGGIELGSKVAEQTDAKGKGKGKAGPKLLGDDAVQGMTRPQMEAELRELGGLKEDLALKVEELKTSPNEPAESAPVMAAKALDKELNALSPSKASLAPKQVNDLTSAVRKKKKAPEPAAPAIAGPTAATTSTKRKAEEEAPESPSDKKVKLEDA